MKGKINGEIVNNILVIHNNGEYSRVHGKSIIVNIYFHPIKTHIYNFKLNQTINQLNKDFSTDSPHSAISALLLPNRLYLALAVSIAPSHSEFQRI